MPRVLRIINRFNLGGPTYNVAYLSKYLVPEFETLLVGGEKEESEDSSEFILEKLGLKPIIIPEMKRQLSWKNDRAAYKKIKKIIQEFKPDIVHTHASKAGTLGRLAAYNCKVPVIVHTFHGHVFHSYFGKLKTFFYKSVERYLAKKSTFIIAISEKQKHELAQVYKICKAEKIKIIPLGFDLQRFQENKIEKRKAFRKQYNIDEDELVISIVGRLVPIKNHRLFLEALKIVSNKTSIKIRAFIIGDGEERANIENYARQLKINFSDANKSTEKNLLTFTSWIKDIDIAMAGSDIIALTSFNEGTPVSLIEAQAAGKPIVSCKVGGIENIVLEGKTALLSENNNAVELAQNILILLQDGTLREKFSDNGWDFVNEKFSYHRLTNDMKFLYRNLMNQEINR
ncbi:MAG TPA: glycosyltransferase [Bacteroidia bacterium]|nr:glycosyltransferase [Bacteroidia bacterium]